MNAHAYGVLPLLFMPSAKKETGCRRSKRKDARDDNGDA